MVKESPSARTTPVASQVRLILTTSPTRTKPSETLPLASAFWSSAMLTTIPGLLAAETGELRPTTARSMAGIKRNRMLV